MQINNNALSLFDFLGNQEKADEVFNQIKESKNQSTVGAISVFEQGLLDEKYEATLKQIEKGELQINDGTVMNYLSFNLNRLNEMMSSVRDSFQLPTPLSLKIEEEQLTVEGDINDQKVQRLQSFLDKHTELTGLAQQTSRLSKFVEWSEAKKQAAEFQQEDMPEETLVEFLKDARVAVTQTDVLDIGRESLAFRSQGYTKEVISKYVEEPVTS